jgi:glycosyltransferase involved in cell wall biosynthesis
MHVVTQSIDVEMFNEGRLRWGPLRSRIREDLGLSGCVFTYVGRLWRGKGLDYLLDAYAALGPLPRTLLLIGDGPDEQHYRYRCAELPRVIFTGFVQQHDLPRMYAASDVFVFPKLGDPNGLVVEEAMIAGLPVVSSDAAGDIHVRLPDGVAGFVVPARSVTPLAAAMRELAENEAMRTSMARAARALASQRTHRRYAEDFAHFVTTVLASPRV